MVSSRGDPESSWWEGAAQEVYPAQEVYVTEEMYTAVIDLLKYVIMSELMICFTLM